MKSKTKIVIFGGCGFVGGHIARAAKEKGYEPILAGKGKKPKLVEYKWYKCDITDKSSVSRIVLKEKPKVVINAAAVADIQYAQDNQELAYKVNVEGAKNIAEACKLAGSSYVFFSSDAVYKGDAPSYREEDAPDPVNYYGYTKQEAEKKIFEVMPEAKVIRISLVLGLPINGGNPFYVGLKNSLASGRDILCPPNQIRTPIDVTTLANAVLELGFSSYSGVLHIGAKSSISRFELTCKTAELMGYDRKKIVEMSREQVSKGTPRHNNGILDVSKAVKILKTPMPTVDDAIKLACQTIPNISQ